MGMHSVEGNGPAPAMGGPVLEETKAKKKSSEAFDVLGDFTATTRILPISLVAAGIGVICAFVALALLKLIGFFTNLFFFHRFSSAMVSPDGNHLGYGVIVVPIVGALIIGLMARYGSDRIRGHG